MMPDTLRPFASRIAGLVVGALCSYALIRWKLDVPEDVRSLLIDALVTAIIGGATYLGTHFAIAAKTNPDDAATPGAAKAGKAKQNARKLARQHAKIDAMVSTDIPMPGQSFVSAPLTADSVELPPPRRLWHDTED